MAWGTFEPQLNWDFAYNFGITSLCEDMNMIFFMKDKTYIN